MEWAWVPGPQTLRISREKNCRIEPNIKGGSVPTPLDGPNDFGFTEGNKVKDEWDRARFSTR